MQITKSILLTENSENIAEEVENETAVTKCPACGANMVFLPEEGCLYCEHCGTKQQIEAKSSEELDLALLLKENNTWAGETHVFRCENCGAKEILDKAEFARTCSFCRDYQYSGDGRAFRYKTERRRSVQAERGRCRGNVKKWAKKKLFAPRRFKKSVTPEGIKGVYNPAFSFDTDTLSHYSGVLGKYYYRTKRVNGKTVQERYVKYFNVSGTYSMFFDDILIQAPLL